jgi:hypothetical protein
MQRVFDHFGLRQEVFQESYTLIAEPENYAKFQHIQTNIANQTIKRR